MNRIAILDGYGAIPSRHRKGRHTGRACSLKRVTIKKGKRLIATFMAHKGPGCPPAKHPRPANAAIFSKIGRFCAKKGRPGSKSNVSCLRHEWSKQ